MIMRNSKLKYLIETMILGEFYLIIGTIASLKMVFIKDQALVARDRSHLFHFSLFYRSTMNTLVIEDDDGF